MNWIDISIFSMLLCIYTTTLLFSLLFQQLPFGLDANLSGILIPTIGTIVAHYIVLPNPPKNGLYNASSK